MNPLKPKLQRLLGKMKKNREISAMRPPLFIYGPPRSGSTFFVKALNEHEQIFVTNELRVMAFTNDLFNRFLTDQRLNWTLRFQYKDAFISHFRKEMGNVIRKFYLEYMPTPDAVWGDKHPHYADPVSDPGALTTIMEIFPDAKFIHIYRNPRSVINSIVSKGWLNFEQAVKKYKLIFTTGREFGLKLGKERYFEVKYEDMVNDGTKVMHEVCAFLDIPMSRRLAKFMQNQEKSRTPVAEPITNPDEIGKNKTLKFTPDEEHHLAEELGDIMKTLMYD